MSGYAKLFSSITASTIWGEDNETRIVWITMLAMADASGYVGASVPGLARIANVSSADVERALAKFEAPDKHSRNQDNDGRRVRKVDRGWLLLNYAAFRATKDPDARREQDRDRKRAQRERDKQDKRDNPPPSEKSRMSAQAEAEAEAENPPVVLPAGGPPADKAKPKRRKGPMPDTWAPNATAEAKATELGLHPLTEAEDFREWTNAKGTLYVNWDAGFLSHLRSQVKRAGKQASEQQELPEPREWSAASALPPKVSDGC